MKIKRSKEWWLARARKEGDSEVTIHPPAQECDGCGLEFWGGAIKAYLQDGMCPGCRLKKGVKP